MHFDALPQQETPIIHRYLNMDTKQFVNSAEDLVKATGKGTHIAIPDMKNNRVLFASGKNLFTPEDVKRIAEEIINENSDT